MPPTTNNCHLCAQPHPRHQGCKDEWDIPPVLKTLAFAMGSVNAHTLLGGVHLDLHVDDSSIEIPS